MASSSVAQCFASLVGFQPCALQCKGKGRSQGRALWLQGEQKGEFIPRPVSTSAGWETSPEAFVKAAFDRDSVILTSVMTLKNGPCKRREAEQLKHAAVPDCVSSSASNYSGTVGKGQSLYLSSVRCGNTYPKFQCVRILREKQHMLLQTFRFLLKTP